VIRKAFAMLCSVFALSAAAAPVAVQVGEARIGLDAPPGFADTGFTGSPRLQEVAESLTSASNRILLFAISDDDLRRFMGGDTPGFRRYMIAVTPRGLEYERVTTTIFGGFVGDALRELGSAPAEGNYAKVLDAEPAGKATLLAELRKEPEVVSVLQGTRVPAQGKRDEPPRYMLSSTTLILLRGKALSLSMYSQYESPADADWIRGTTVRWIDALQRLNKR
jgi:hypothetical protein